MLVIGLVGGVASGKSFVAECFAELGAEIIDADKIGHVVLSLPTVISKIQTQWPEVVRDQQVDRKSLSRIVFHSPTHAEQLTKLEQITHPSINQIMSQQLIDFQALGCTAVILDAPVLFKAGWQRRCDKIVFIETTLDVRAQRAKSRGWLPDELEKREQSQTPLPQIRQLATDILDNSRSRNETRQQVHHMWVSWGLTVVENPLIT